LRQDSRALQRISLLPYFLYSRPQEERLRTLSLRTHWHDCSGDHEHPYLSHKLLPARPSPAACTKCIDEDLRTHGFTWWRRSHQIPGIGRCYKHGCALAFGCVHCGAWVTSPHLRLPTLDCRCNHFVQSQVFEAAWTSQLAGQRIARVASEILLDAEPLNLDSMRAALRSEVLHRYGKGASVWSALGRDVMKFVGEKYISRNAQLPLQTAAAFSRSACGYGHWPIPIERYVALIAFLFDDLGALKRAASFCANLMESPRAPSSASTANDPLFKAGRELRDLLKRHNGNFNAASREYGKSPHIFRLAVAKQCPDIFDAQLTSEQRRAASSVRALFVGGTAIVAIERLTGVSRQSIRELASANPELRQARTKSRMEARTEKTRSKVRQLIKQGLNRSDIGKVMARSQKEWLSTFDHQWVADNYPESRSKISSSEWAVRDSQWAAAVPKAFVDIIDRQVLRVRLVTRCKITKAIGCKYSERQELLPKTTAALEQYHESNMSFLLRRVVRAVQTLSKRQNPPTMFALARQTNIPLNELSQYLWLVGFDPS
jgi:hypothetical protein